MYFRGIGYVKCTYVMSSQTVDQGLSYSYDPQQNWPGVLNWGSVKREDGPRNLAVGSQDVKAKPGYLSIFHVYVSLCDSKV